jgi:beta-N-acetylhexosaminidase
MSRFIARIQPDLTVWIHQPYGIVVDSPTASRAALRGYAKRVGLPLTSLGFLSGTAIRWQRAHRPGSDNLVVELAGVGPVSAATVSRHVAAIFGVAKAGAARAAAARKPTIVQSPIPFGADRRRQMRAYARRHYGLGSELLTDPKVIVEHFTASSTYSSAFNTFAGNAPDPELHELPGVCAHFVVDRDGTIHQLVALRFMCRHTIGLNDSAIGIEHVGLSDAQVMGDRRQLAASLRLTRWLMGEYGIERKNVIGHAESLSSPYHHERVKALRTRTHGDMARPAMRRYRKLLEAGPQ